MTSPTLTCSAASAALRSQPNAQDSARSDSAKLNHTLAACSQSDSLTCQTSETLGESNLLPGLDMSQFSLGDFPASRGVLPGSKEAQQMTAISGRQCCVLLKQRSPLGLLVKTCLESYPADSTRSLMIWRAQVTRRNRLLFRLAQLVPGTSGTASGFVPTIGKNEGKGASRKRFKGSAHFRGAKMAEGLRTSFQDPIYTHPHFAAASMGYPKNWAHTEMPSSRK